jgi:hypothetical protein
MSTLFEFVSNRTAWIGDAKHITLLINEEIYTYILKGFDGGIENPESRALWDLSFVQNSTLLENTTFRKLRLFPS